MLAGRIQSLRPEKGFGFIRPEDGGTDVFFHRSSVRGSFAVLSEGQAVTYVLEPGAERPRASEVHLASASASERFPRPRDRSPDRRGTSRSAPRGRMVEQHPPARDCQHGFVTKLRREEPHGFISADSGGTEIRFEPSTVVGEKRFNELIVGDYVEFAIRADTVGTKSPEAYYVREIERQPHFPQTQLSRHPKARRKKPSWR